MTAVEWYGLKVPVPTTKVGTGLPLQVPGEHLWIVTGAWSVNPAAWPGSPDDKVHLDSENLVTIVGPGCLWCEQEFEPRLVHRRCPGEPR